MIHNVIFDMGGVLIRWDPQALVSRMGLPLEDGQLLVKELFTSPYWVMLDRGVVTEQQVVEAVKIYLPERLHAPLEELVTGWWKRPLFPVEGMAELVRELHDKGYHIYLLSNANLALRQYFGRIPGSRFFEALLVSAEEKLVKPEHEIYETLFERFGLDRQECFFIDDSPANVEASIHLGMQAVRFNGSLDRLRSDMAAAGIDVRTDV